ncbi:MAG: hypothetical protein QG596_960 [Actinomycetota bacterium]|jgi:hypothetical protein|nr:hypothetical protein [Actinomycetota bacterium]
MKKLLATTSVLLSLVLAGPALAEEPEPVDPGIASGKAAREFKQAREKWLGWGVSDYRMTVSRSCFCVSPQEVTVTVRKGKAVRISARPWYGPRTVPAMFRIVGQAIRQKVPILDVRYDGRLGYPKQTSIDYIALAADDEIGYRISGFRTLRP